MSEEQSAESILIRTLLHNDMLSEDQIGKCQLLQEAIEGEEGLKISIGELILQKGYLTEQHLKIIAAKLKEKKDINVSNILPLRLIYAQLKDERLTDRALSAGVVSEDDVVQAREWQKSLTDYGLKKSVPELLVETGAASVQELIQKQDAEREPVEEAAEDASIGDIPPDAGGQEEVKPKSSSGGGLQIDDYLDQSTRTVDRKDLGKDKVKVLNKKKFRKLISKSIDTVIENRDEDLSEEERQNVSDIVQQEFKKTGLKDIPKSLQDFFDEILSELDRIKEAVQKVPVRTSRLTEMQQESADAGAIVNMMKDEKVQGKVSSVDREEESEGVSSAVERLKQIKSEEK